MPLPAKSRPNLPVLRACYLIALATALIVTVRAQSPSLTHTVPGALAPGQTAEITCVGAGRVGATNLWTSCGATVISATATNAGAAKFRVAVPTDTPVGIYAARVASMDGVSSPLLFMVDDLPGVP